jgi:hypothetical protein
MKAPNELSKIIKKNKVILNSELLMTGDVQMSQCNKVKGNATTLFESKNGSLTLLPRQQV